MKADEYKEFLKILSKLEIAFGRNGKTYPTEQRKLIWNYLKIYDAVKIIDGINYLVQYQIFDYGLPFVADIIKAIEETAGTIPKKKTAVFTAPPRGKSIFGDMLFSSRAYCWKLSENIYQLTVDNLLHAWEFWSHVDADNMLDSGRLSEGTPYEKRQWDWKIICHNPAGGEENNQITEIPDDPLLAKYPNIQPVGTALIGKRKKNLERILQAQEWIDSGIPPAEYEAGKKLNKDKTGD